MALFVFVVSFSGNFAFVAFLMRLGYKRGKLAAQIEILDGIDAFMRGLRKPEADPVWVHGYIDALEDITQHLKEQTQ